MIQVTLLSGNFFILAWHKPVARLNESTEIFPKPKVETKAATNISAYLVLGEVIHTTTHENVRSKKGILIYDIPIVEFVTQVDIGIKKTPSADGISICG